MKDKLIIMTSSIGFLWTMSVSVALFARNPSVELALFVLIASSIVLFVLVNTQLELKQEQDCNLRLMDFTTSILDAVKAHQDGKRTDDVISIPDECRGKK